MKFKNIISGRNKLVSEKYKNRENGEEHNLKTRYPGEKKKKVWTEN